MNTRIDRIFYNILQYFLPTKINICRKYLSRDIIKIITTFPLHIFTEKLFFVHLPSSLVYLEVYITSVYRD